MDTIPHPVTTEKTSRVRASDRALRITLKAMQDAGLPVHKVCISGGKIDIHCQAVEATATVKKDARLKEW
jgi:hypothetical protein